MRERTVEQIVAVALMAILMPALVFAQASITGVVRDTSGAVLPGVNVEATSPALIEKVRSTVTNDTGQYRIENLRPGTYEVTFALAGFSTVRRDAIELQGSFSATINADMRVGEIAETVTVTGESPIVDVQNTTQQRVLSHEVIDAIPTGRSDKNLATLIPGVSIAGGISQDVGGTQDQVSSQLVVHGSRGTDQRLTQNGVSLGITANGANTLIVATNLSAYQEMTIDTGAVSAELPTGGVRVNYIPKDGGNRVSGTMVFGFGTGGMQSENFTDELKAAGLGTPNALKRNYDYNPGIGGPILPDRLWFHLAYKDQSTASYAGGIFANRNANNPNAWTYEADTSSRPYNVVDGSDLHARLTWQMLPKVKFGFSWQESGYCACADGINATTSPEAALYRKSTKQRNLMGDWTIPLTNNLLIDGAFINRHQDLVRHVPPGYENPAMIAVTEQALGNLTYRTVNVGAGNPTLRNSDFRTMFVRSAVSYVTGGHVIKAGFTYGNGNEYHISGNLLPGAIPYSYTFNNGVPNQITLFGYPQRSTYTTDSDSGAYVQNKWTNSRMTLSAGLRFDHFANSAPESVAGPTQLLPTRNLVFPATDGVNFKDLTPKLGAVYDLAGDGKTALKVSLNKYVLGLSSGDPIFGSVLMPINRVGNATTRSWNDRTIFPAGDPRNGNYVPDCDLANPVANGECGAMANQNFGRATGGNVYNPDILEGWGVRSYNWEFSAGVQRELFPRASLDVSYFRRWYGNFFVIDNRAVTPSDVGTFSVPATATDSRLPSAGETITGFYDLNPSVVGRVDNYLTRASDYGDQSETWSGVDVNFNVRIRGGLLLQGGSSTGRTSTDTCEIREKLPETSLLNPFCDTSTPWLTQLKFVSAYTIPRIGVNVSGTLQNLPGPALSATYVASNAIIAPSLGRPLSGGAANRTVNLIAPASANYDRYTQVDLRIGKSVRVGTYRAGVNLDMYNALNANSVLALNTVFGGARPWLTPQSIMQGRLLKISGQFDF
jgi:hypothetical protein